MIRDAPVVAGLALLALAACASLSEEACRAGDWAGIGFRDGAAGRPDGYVARHAEACAEVGIAPDLAAWRAGRAEGLTVYCTRANAYELGRRGTRLAAVCPGADALALAAANDRGLRWWELGREIDRLEAEVAELDRRIDRLLEDDLDRDGRRLVRALRADAAARERALRLLAAERARYA